MNINYLQHFYHLFPIHVEKFYLLFDRYVNPKIEALKPSIQLFEGEKASISDEINNLENTNETIQKLSTQIKSNVDELNKTIGDYNRFKYLVENVKSQINDKISKIKDMNRTTQITEALNLIVQGIKQQAEQKLQEVQKKFQQHEEEFKKKIYQLVGQIKSVLKQLADDGGNSKIKELEVKINGLVGRPKEATGHYGKLVMLCTKMFALRETRKSYRISFLKVGLTDSGPVGKKVKEGIDNLIGKMVKNREYIKTIVEALKGILDPLGKDKQKINDIILGLRGYNDSNIGQYESKIGGYISKIKGLKVLGNMESKYSSSLAKGKEAIRFVQGFKTLVKEWKDILSIAIKSLVENMPKIEEEELDEIDSLLKEIKNLGKTTYRDLENTQKMFKYLTCVKDKNSEITEMSINGTSLEEIGTTIESVTKANTAIKKANEEIQEARKKLEKGLEEDSDQGRTEGKGNGEKKNMMPKELDLNGDVKKLGEYQGKLAAIQKFNATLIGVTSGISELNGNLQQRQGSDVVKGALDYLNQIDGTLTKVYRSTNSAVTEMEKSYNLNKTKINAPSSGNGAKIQKQVEEIEKIPDKITQLHSQVKYYIVLLNISKSLN